jgi:hypothetical protein
MNAKVKEILIQSGWYETREEDVDNIVKVFKEKYNIIIHNSALTFLKQFSNLTISFIDPIYHRYLTTIVVINNSIQHLILPDVAYEGYCNYYKKVLVPVAEIDAYDMVLLIDEEGKFYGTSEQFASVIGDTLKKF